MTPEPTPGSDAGMEELAIDGGAPLRSELYPTKMLGAAYIGEEELEELRDVRVVRYHDLGFVRPVFLLAQIRKLPGIIARCRASHQRIRERLGTGRRFTYRPTEQGDRGITLFLGMGSPEAAKVCPNRDRILDSQLAMGIGPLWSDADVEDVARGIDKVDRLLLREDP